MGEEDRVETSGLLAGTASERAPGVGGTGDHPAPAAVLDGDGNLHQAGEAPAGTSAQQEAPRGDSADLQAGDVTDPEARAKLNEYSEPDTPDTARPDIGTIEP